MEPIKIEFTQPSIGDTGFSIFMLQCALAYIGYKFGYVEDEKRTLHLAGIDGIYGPRTKSLVSMLQSDSGLPVTGEIDRDTLKILFERG